MNTLSKILKHRKNHFSQAGEDGVLDYILSKICNVDNWCVEFGAWDGIHLSNTYYFITKRDYKSVLIEADTEKYNQLCLNMTPFNSICVNEYVNYEGLNTLDNILSSTSIPMNFDLLSIDIDGNDYHVWESLKKYAPKVVIIEINIRNKPVEFIINKKDSPFVWGISGSSIRATTELATKKGYKLVANISCNAIYVKDEYFSLFHKEEMSIQNIFLYEGHQINELTLNELRCLGIIQAFNKLLRFIINNIRLYYRRVRIFNQIVF